MEEVKKVQGGTMVECQQCHKVFYGNIQRKFCDECVKERARTRRKEREKAKREAKRGKIPPPQAVPVSPTGSVSASARQRCPQDTRTPLGKGGSGYVSPEQRFKISAETGRIYAFVREVEVYNRLNGTRLSYGQYENMLFLEREKRKSLRLCRKQSHLPLGKGGNTAKGTGETE